MALPWTLLEAAPQTLIIGERSVFAMVYSSATSGILLLPVYAVFCLQQRLVVTVRPVLGFTKCLHCRFVVTFM